MMTGEHPTGFRFYPTEEELISFYLQNLLQGTLQDRLRRIIPVLNVYSTEPWNLPQHAGDLNGGDMRQWFFFVPLQEREARGGRPRRSMPTGYWKSTGSPSNVYSSDDKVIGVKKSMVFYVGKAPSGRKTRWKLNEYRAFEVSSTSNTSMLRLRHEYTLCRLYVVSGSSRAFDQQRRNMAAQEMTQGASSSGPIRRSHRAASTSSLVILEDHAGSSSHGGTTAVTITEDEHIWPDWEHFNWDEFLSP